MNARLKGEMNALRANGCVGLNDDQIDPDIAAHTDGIDPGRVKRRVYKTLISNFDF